MRLSGWCTAPPGARPQHRWCRASVVLSGYDAPLYAELFDGWHRLDLQGATTLSGDTDRVEVLWSNRPLGEASLFDLLDGGAA